jgi:hypothetical protein
VVNTMTMTVGNVPGLAVDQLIDVRVDYDDGWISLAAVPGRNFRCYVNTAERRVYWEAQHTGAWTPVGEDAVDLPVQLRAAMRRAAAAGLVAAGIRS